MFGIKRNGNGMFNMFTMIMLFINSIIFAQNIHTQIIDVHIKGIDDGIKTSRQQDYKEAVLFAKREAIERSGVEIKSITTIKDFILNSDYIETKAEAILQPGYKIIDVGYQLDNTYLVFLIGKISLGKKESTTNKISFQLKIYLKMNRSWSTKPKKYYVALNDSLIWRKKILEINKIVYDGKLKKGNHKVIFYSGFQKKSNELTFSLNNNKVILINVNKNNFSWKENVEIDCLEEFEYKELLLKQYKH